MPSDTPAFSRRRIPRCHLGVSLPADLGAQLAEHCATHRVSKSLYTEVALRRSLAQDMAAQPAAATGPLPPATGSTGSTGDIK